VKQKQVGGNSTQIVDSFNASTWRTAEYLFQFAENAGTKVKSLKLLVTKDDIEVKETVFARQGSTIDLEVNSNLNGGNIEIEVVNKETFAIDVSFARLRL